MFNYRHKRTPTRQCWNGLNCYYFRRGRCNFYHPSEHIQGLNSKCTLPYFSIEDEEDQFFKKQTQQLIDQQSDKFQKEIRKLIFTNLFRKQFHEIHKEKEDEKKKKAKQKYFQYEKKLIPRIQIISNLKDKDNAILFEKTPHFYQFSGSKFDQCSICLQGYEKKNLITLLYCNHAYHRQCIQKWLQNNVKCPLCKKDFKLHKQYHEFQHLLRRKKLMPWFSITVEDQFDF